MKSKTFTSWAGRILLLAGLVVSGASAETIIVDPGGTGDFDNIQEAINASFDGDTIIVKPGTYNENIHFNNRAVTLTSEDPDNTSIVESTIITDGVTFDWAETAESVLTGFTITTTGISCVGSSPTISKNIITNCSTGGIRGSGNAYPTIVSNTITNNSSSTTGGGVYNCDGPITNNTITGNSVTSGGGYARGGGLADCSGTISNNIIVNNTASSSGNYAYGGGLYNCDGTITDNTVANNTATTTADGRSANGGGMYSCGGTIANNTITNNSVTCNNNNTDAYGGGLASCNGMINNNTIADNNATCTGSADSAYGGGLYQCNGTIIHNTVVNNIASSETFYAYGGGLCDCDATIINNTIVGNSAVGSLGYGGGMGYCNATIKNNIIVFNQAGNNGGGIYSSSGNSYNDFYLNELDNFGGGSSFGTGDITRDPLFANAAIGDYHLKSEFGRWSPDSQSWVLDLVTSGCIDAGDPGDDWSSEPLPNGGRINMGAYGGTAEASKTNVQLLLTLLNPNGGEQIAAGDIYIISWSSNYAGGDIIIDYSTDNGQNWNTVTTVDDTGSYEWLVPAVASVECLLRITSVTYPAVGDVSDAVFEIYEPVLSLIKPNGGEAILRGSSYDIVWSSIMLAGDVLIEYSSDNGQNWNAITTVENTGSYEWLVPTAASVECLVKISSVSYPAVDDVSDDIFEIYEPMLSLIQPNGGEAILRGSSYDIVWSSVLPTGDVFIEYSVDNGHNWSELITAEDTGSYQWQVSSPASNQYLLRITDADGTGVTDATDSIFTIYSCQDQMAGDLNKDCVVDIVDFAILVENWLDESHARIFYSAFDNNPNWATQGQWAFGEPTGNGGAVWGNPDPDSGHTGSNVYGVNLNGDYSLDVGGPYNLTAGPFDCNKFQDIKLRFARWLNTDEPDFVASTVEVSNDGANWYPVWEHTEASSITDSNWQILEYDVSETADNEPTVYFRWSYDILDDRAYPYSGWNIDDVELLGKP